MGLARIALKHRCVFGSRPSINKLIQAIGRGELTVVDPDTLIDGGAFQIAAHTTQEPEWCDPAPAPRDEEPATEPEPPAVEECPY